MNEDMGAISGSCPAGQAALRRLAASRFDPERWPEIALAFHDLYIACVKWASVDDHCLMHMPTEELERAGEVLEPIFGEPA